MACFPEDLQIDSRRSIRPEVSPDLHAVIAELRDWLVANPGVERRDDESTRKGHPKSSVTFQVDHLDDTDLRIERPSFPNALRRLVEMAETGLDVDEMIEPAVTRPPRQGQRGGENPCFILVGTEGAEGLACDEG